MMTKEYLKRAIRIEREIDSLLEHLAELRSMATKATATVSDMPGSPMRDSSKMEEAILKIIEQEEEIDARVDELVHVKREIEQAINRVTDDECRQVLRLRYLAFKSWDEVAACMRYNVRQVYRIHAEALKKFQIPESCQS